MPKFAKRALKRSTRPAESMMRYNGVFIAVFPLLSLSGGHGGTGEENLAGCEVSEQHRAVFRVNICLHFYLLLPLDFASSPYMDGVGMMCLSASNGCSRALMRTQPASRVSLFRRVRTPRFLSLHSLERAGLPERYSRGGSHIERIYPVRHGDHDRVFRGSKSPRRQPMPFSAHNKRQFRVAPAR